MHDPLFDKPTPRAPALVLHAEDPRAERFDAWYETTPWGEVEAAFTRAGAPRFLAELDYELGVNPASTPWRALVYVHETRHTPGGVAALLRAVCRRG